MEVSLLLIEILVHLTGGNSYTTASCPVIWWKTVASLSRLHVFRKITAGGQLEVWHIIMIFPPFKNISKWMYWYCSNLKRYCEDRKKMYAKICNLEKFGQISEIFVCFLTEVQIFSTLTCAQLTLIVNAFISGVVHSTRLDFNIQQLFGVQRVWGSLVKADINKISRHS